MRVSSALSVVYKSTGGRLWNKPWVRSVTGAQEALIHCQGACKVCRSLMELIAHAQLFRSITQGLPPLSESQKANRSKQRKAEQELERILNEAASKEGNATSRPIKAASKRA